MEEIYIKNGGKGFIGFESFKEAELFAKEHNGDIVHLRRRDGSDSWESLGIATDMFTLSAEEDYGDDYSFIKSASDWKEKWHNDLRNLLDEDVEIEDLVEFVNEMQAINEQVNTLAENEAVLLCQGQLCEIIKFKTMSCHIDVWTDAIGVELKDN